MKKITIVLVVLMLIAPLMSITIETKGGETVKGAFTKKIANRYNIKTITGNIVVFEEEIERVISDTGRDITETFLAMEPEPTPEPLPPVSPMLFTNAKVISTPLWVLTISTIAFYAYSVFNMERVNKDTKKMLENAEAQLP